MDGQGDTTELYLKKNEEMTFRDKVVGTPVGNPKSYIPPSKKSRYAWYQPFFHGRVLPVQPFSFQ